jgi:hypothetical protein
MSDTAETTSRASTRRVKPFSGSRSISFLPVHEPATSEPPRARPRRKSAGVIAEYRPYVMLFVMCMRAAVTASLAT